MMSGEKPRKRSEQGPTTEELLQDKKIKDYLSEHGGINQEFPSPDLPDTGDEARLFVDRWGNLPKEIVDDEEGGEDEKRTE